MDIMISPQSGLSYGDKVSLTGTLTDEKNLKMIHYPFKRWK